MQAEQAPVARPAPAGRSVDESKLERSRLEPLAEAVKDARREKAPRETSLPASPPAVMDKGGAETERTLLAGSAPAAPAASVEALSKQESASTATFDEKSRLDSPPAQKMAAREAFDPHAERGSGLGSARVAAMKKKSSAATAVTVVCLLRPDGDTVEEIESLLKREGAVDLEVRALEPPALRAAVASQRERLGDLSEPLLGWTLTARMQTPALARLLEALKARAGLRILEQPAATVVSVDSGEPTNLHITVLR
jgi:hypothetical protein